MDNDLLSQFHELRGFLGGSFTSRTVLDKVGLVGQLWWEA